MTVFTCQYTTTVSGSRAQNDFNQFKFTLSVYCGDKSLSCCSVSRNLAAQFPDSATIAKIALVMPMSSVPAQRRLSVQNVIKADSKNQLRKDCISRLMILNIHRKSVTDFDMGAATNWFFAMKTCRK